MAGLSKPTIHRLPILLTRTPPTFDFRDAHILDAKAIGSSPPKLEVPLEIISSSKLVFNPIAMNDGNVVSARVLMTPPNTSPRVTGHIVGVNRIRDGNYPLATSKERGFFTTVSCVLVCLALAPQVCQGRIVHKCKKVGSTHLVGRC